MFDPDTAAFLRSAPGLAGLDPHTLPERLTAHYAELVARRLRGATAASPEEMDGEDEWPLERIADTYELITSIHDDPKVRRASAFVAGTAQQILAQAAQATEDGIEKPILSRDRVDPSLSAAVLFLAAEQYADAHEAAQRIRIVDRQQEFVATLLAERVQDFTSGKLRRILSRARKRTQEFRTPEDLEARATTALFEALLTGVELFAAEVLSRRAPETVRDRFASARAAFSRVLELSTSWYQSTETAPLLTTYPGPRHLAALLLAAYDATAQAAVTKIDPPGGTDGRFWRKWLRHRAAEAPFLWPNHGAAVEKRFHHTGTSAVVVLPTGAGKTTVSCLKIASVLGQNKSVIFIAPTHALVDQLKDDLQKIFPEDLLGSIVSSDFDQMFAVGSTLRQIEVMTPEHCLALLSYAPEIFAEVGLLVFDECHLLSAESGLRRSLDGMFCVLAFNSVAPDSDFLFLSAMIKNGQDFANWIEHLTGRHCVFVDALWKPSRQARGVVVYEARSIDEVRRAADRVQRDIDTAAVVRRAATRKQQDIDTARRKTPKPLGAAAKRELLVKPFALFGLHHNWLPHRSIDFRITPLLGHKVELSGSVRRRNVHLTGNVNKVSAQIAVKSAEVGAKCIIFVNNKGHAVSTARNIASALEDSVTANADEEARWQALDVELGERKHSLLTGPASAVAHHAGMLKLERELSQSMFRRKDGAKVIVATPTLAQGLNLPAHLAILASDMRMEEDEHGDDDDRTFGEGPRRRNSSRQPLRAHEILNAAARAGRAGHLANGVVLLVPEEILEFKNARALAPDAERKLRSILPDDDRCIDIIDPLEVILDRISEPGGGDPNTEYALNRYSTVAALEEGEAGTRTRFSTERSFAAFMALRRETLAAFDGKVAALKTALDQRMSECGDLSVLELAAQSGASVTVLTSLRNRLEATRQALPVSIAEWVSWTCSWLAEDEQSRSALLQRESREILKTIGRKENAPFSGDAISTLCPGLLAWISGKQLIDIERALGGDPKDKKQLECPRARRLITRLVPMGITYVIGLVAKTAQDVLADADNSLTAPAVIGCLHTAVRRGFDTPAKIAFAETRKGILGRVQLHRAFEVEIGDRLSFETSDDYASVLAKMRTIIAN